MQQMVSYRKFGWELAWYRTVSSTSTSVLGKRNRTMGDTMDMEEAVDTTIEKRPRSEALGTAFEVDSEVVKENS